MAISLVILIGISMLCFASAQTRVPGVSVGDRFKYSVNFSMNASNSSITLTNLIEGLLSQVENIDSVQANVTQVAGSKVTMQAVMQFKNGTQQSTTSTFDVANGQDTAQEGTIGLLLIAANLNAGDQIYTTGSGGTINETVTRTFPSGSRQVNHQNIVMNYDVSPEELQGTGITTALQQSNTEDTYWDKQTGALVEMSYNMTTRSQQVNADISLHVQLIESNVFAVSQDSVPEFPAITLFAILALAVLVFAVAIRYKGISAKSVSLSLNS